MSKATGSESVLTWAGSTTWLGPAGLLARATWEGHAPVQRIATLQNPGEQLQVVLSLPPPPAPTPETPPAQPPAEKRPAIAYGRLTLVTKPWCHVFLGNRKLGDTPLLDIAIPAGRQVLRMVNEDKNIKSSIEVDILPGKLTVKKLSL